MQVQSGVTTILFTDIAGSSRLWAESPEQMALAHARHDAIVRGAVETHGGRLVKMTGDGVHAGFGDPLDSVAAALDVQLALSDAASTGGLPLLVRCGMHVGLVELRDNDMFGTPVNRAARITASAHGGQVLLSQSVADIVSARLPEPLALRDLGAARLRDLAGAERLFQLVHPRLRQEFPALRSLEATSNNLPTQLTSFVGRQRELGEARALLAKARLLTLHGPGGIGKTRLALHVAADVIHEYPDGVWFVDLAPIADPAFVPKAVARAIGVREGGAEPVADTLCAHFRSRRALMILDNCEHLVGACADLVEALLRTSAELRIIATSREALRVPGEQRYPLSSLSLPADSRDPSVLSRSEAVQLFVERSRLHQPRFALTPQHAPAVAELCARLDGMPLALELAAARVATLPVDQIVERLHDRFRLLTVANRAAMPRQQTLRSLITWSFELLDESERRLFARLSVFAGGFGLEAAELLAAGDDIPVADVVDLLSSLVAKSLVAIDEDRGRYHLLETIREYAEERLRAAGDGERFRARHFDCFLELALRVEPSLVGGPLQKPALDQLEADHDNLRAALAWSLEVPERSDLALRMCATLYRFWSRRGHWQEGYAWCMKALAQAPRTADKAACARVLLTAGSIGNNVLDAQTRDLLEEALALAREAGDRATEATVLNNLARVLDWGVDLARARSLLEQARAINRQRGDRTLELHNASNLVNVLREQGDAAAALALAEEGLAASLASGDRWLEAIFHYLLGRVALDRGDVDAARNCNGRALALARELDMPDWQSFSLAKLAYVAVVCDDPVAARSHLVDALGIARKFGARINLAECFVATGILAEHVGSQGQGARFWGVAERLLGSLSSSDLLERAQIEPFQRRCREVLGEEAYDAARAAGTALPRETAVSEALAWLATVS
ncbi:MAG: adenylate/guanylate cyclase domain-containing protein [Burkholderiales bacterium]